MILRLVSRGAWTTFALLGLMLAHPTGAWYKHVASPRYHIVGRASGLLMGVRRSPYLWRRELEEEPRENLDDASSLPANGAPHWQRLLPMLKVEDKPWTALEHPHQKSKVGPWKGIPSKRTFLHQASPKSHTGKGLLAALQHSGIAWTPQCPPGCQEMPWRSPSTTPELLERAMRKHEKLDTAAEPSIFEPKI